VSRYAVSLRIIGEDDLENMDEVTHVLGGTSCQFFKKGMRRRGGRIQPRNVVLLDLARWEEEVVYWEEDPGSSATTEQSWRQVLATLAPLANKLRSLDRSLYHPALYISTIRDYYMGGFGLSSDVVAIAYEANLPIDISILVDIEDEASPETEETESSE